ncbi:MAG: methyl-accepting chemotaxis protein [Spirochaetaceae bacterium]|jgi:methyl-accepting chemotaxis protein|nr:methyl-accepting chemotaxis protein [Spirochaetaceae bacterium]
MKLKFRLSLIVTGMTFIFISTVAAILLLASRTLQTGVAFENMTNLSHGMAEEVRVYFEVSLNTVHTLANVYNGYEEFMEENRLPIINRSMQSAIESLPKYISIYSVWRPGILDETGYSRIYSRKTGSIQSGNYAEAEPEEYALCQEAFSRNMNEEFISEPYSMVYQGKTIWVVRMFSPITVGSQVVGVVGAEVDITAIQTFVSRLKPYGAGSASLFSSGGIVTAASDPAEIGKAFREITAGFDPQKAQIVEDSLKTDETVSLTDNGRIIVSASFCTSTTNIPWTLVAFAPLKTVLNEVARLTQFTIFLGITMLIITAAAVYFMIGFTVKPILGMAQSLKDISEGEGDLTHQIAEHGNDEISDMARYFNLTLEKIRTMVITIKNQTVALADLGDELAANMTESAASVNQITANIRSIKGQVLNQSASVTEANATMEQITGNIGKLNKQVERQSVSMSQSSSSIEEMLANIQSVIQTLHKNAGNVEMLLQSSEMGRTGLQEVSEDIQEIARESEGLLEINKVMENIASQTNLLSMNAAIEAAHAGESGRGFAVVAGEIRKLAESSGKQSKTISTVLKKIKVSIDKISESTDNVLKKFEAIDGSVRTVSEQESNIRSAMEEQGAGSKQILEAIEELNDVTQQVKGGSQEMLEGSKEVIQESRNLGRVTEEITNGMNEMASGAEQINTAVSRVTELCGQNRENIGVLVREVARFKVE